MASQTDMAGQGLGLPPQQPQGQSRAGQIGNMLGAFGAGIQGNLPQFQQVQQQRQQSQMEQQRLQQEQQQQLVQERQKTVFQDAQAALNLLENDNLDGVVQLGINRLQSLQNFPDANPEDTQRLTQLAVAARNGSEEAKERLKGELETTVQMGRATGILETPQRDTKVVGDALVDTQTGDVVYESADDEGGDQRDRKIQSLAGRLRDVVEDPEATAIDIVDGNVRVEVLDSGQVRLIDEVAAASGRGDQAVTELPIGTFGEDEDRPQPEQNQTLYSLADQTAGVVPFAKDAYARIAGQFGLDVPEDVVEARQTVNTAKNDMIRALSINPRFPAAEIKRLEKEINITPSAFDSPAALKARMRSIDRSLRTQMEQNLAAAADPSLSPDARSDARRAARDIRDFLDVMGVPERLDIESINSVDAINEIPPEDVKTLIQDMTEDEYNQLSEDVRQAMVERVRNGQ